MERPVTSKPRGVCKYYNTARGCFAGDACKFLHGADEKYSPYDKAKVCRYYVKGHCTRGDRCWFRHELPKAPPEQVQPDAETCSICMEKPTTYGLLMDCSHVFCLQWRDKSGKSPDMVSTGAIKCCPLCRRPSRFITPSSHFFPSGHPRKEEIIEEYSHRYFEQTSRRGKPCCPFGYDCFYQHTRPDGSPHVFHSGAARYMRIYQRAQLRNNSRHSPLPYMGPIRHLRNIFDNIDLIRTRFSNIRERIEDIQTSTSINAIDIEAMLAPEMDEFETPPSDMDDDELDLLFSVVRMQLDEALAVEESLAAAHATSSLNVPQAPDRQTEQRSSDRPASTPPISWGSDTSSLAPSHAAANDDESAHHPELNPTPAPGPSSLTRTPTPRFSTVVNSRSREALAMDASDEEYADAVPTSDSYEDDTADTHTTQDLSSRFSSSVSNVDTRNTAADSNSGNDSRTHSDHNNEPPFVTDGRGRVVWSSACTGRGGQADGREVPSSRANSTTKSTAPARL
ncbi:hypothetical protein BKA82DRAFT_23588 [Pisolithus tinctorius]|uniref:RING-type E3 ubiquitin transferase n=1 Tax=Pisolithus tinctorius Marx 270 TaxID=870435 RepID=A0A0C3PI53_PISTI|nr:hypothetical protein BKA82DRAFT_23588 [Pisolithus tinctorius]KIO07739.1 hypothetical protein M404DRAFT_23588 [Pisolithus tinctorius Marx 270]